ncbi:MAG: hypothetical protein U0807_19345 [Candidatus Binatia bacterium]
MWRARWRAPRNRDAHAPRERASPASIPAWSAIRAAKPTSASAVASARGTATAGPSRRRQQQDWPALDAWGFGTVLRSWHPAARRGDELVRAEIGHAPTDRARLTTLRNAAALTGIEHADDAALTVDHAASRRIGAYVSPLTASAADPALRNASGSTGALLPFAALHGAADQRDAALAFLRQHRSALVNG